MGKKAVRKINPNTEFLRNSLIYVLFQNEDRLLHLSRRGLLMITHFLFLLMYVYAHTGTCAPMLKTEDNLKVVLGKTVYLV